MQGRPRRPETPQLWIAACEAAGRQREGGVSLDQGQSRRPPDDDQHLLDLVFTSVGAGNLCERLPCGVGEAIHDEKLFLAALYAQQQLEQQVL
ncbi:hypothetical protein [Micromonospora inositola]|uniref:hypothetical protein n=1 Tax=Micromonospora inositola TaxID=47865 RepID=UPI000B5AE568|nr:hypothetical protein [Micromonospora inositola]